MLVCLLPIMTIMWLSTSVCVLATIPHLGLYSTLIIGACVTSTDPILSQAIAKGPFADKFVVRPLREIISAEAGANDGFASPFLGLAINLLLQTQSSASSQEGSIARAFGDWVIETLLYTVVLAIIYGVVAGYCARKAVELSLSRKWVDTESYLLFPCALGVSPRDPPFSILIEITVAKDCPLALRPGNMWRDWHQRPSCLLRRRLRPKLGRSVPRRDQAAT